MNIILKKLAGLFQELLDLPKTLYFNLKYLPIKDAVKLPFLVSRTVYLMQCDGEILIDAPIKHGMIKIGYGKVGIFDQHKARSIWQVSGKVIFKGRADIGHGSKICAGGVLTIGADFAITAESQIICEKAISFGNDVLISWDNLFMDTDFHKVIENGEITNSPRAITVGNHVWIGCRCTILKGSNLGDDVIVAANSLICSAFEGSAMVIGGHPATVLKKGVKWEP